MVGTATSVGARCDTAVTAKVSCFAQTDHRITSVVRVLSNEVEILGNFPRFFGRP